MIEIYRFEQYKKMFNILEDFSKSLKKGDVSSKRNINLKNKTIQDLNLNFNFSDFFKKEVEAMHPIVESLLKDINIDLNDDVIFLTTICTIIIIYQEESDINIDERRKIINDSKSLLQELKLRGVGNGIIKKLIVAFNSIKNICSLILKENNTLIEKFMDIFSNNLSYHILNSISNLIDKYEINLENISSNFESLSAGVTTKVGKEMIIDIINSIDDSSIVKKDLIDKIEVPSIQKFGDKTYGQDYGDNVQMIQEQ